MAKTISIHTMDKGIFLRILLAGVDNSNFSCKYICLSRRVSSKFLTRYRYNSNMKSLILPAREWRNW